MIASQYEHFCNRRQCHSFAAGWEGVDLVAMAHAGSYPAHFKPLCPFFSPRSDATKRGLLGRPIVGSRTYAVVIVNILYFPFALGLSPTAGYSVHIFGAAALALLWGIGLGPLSKSLKSFSPCRSHVRCSSLQKTDHSTDACLVSGSVCE